MTGSIKTSIRKDVAVEGIKAESNMGPCQARTGEMDGNGLPLTIECPPAGRIEDANVTVTLSYADGGETKEERCILTKDVERLWWL